MRKKIDAERRRWFKLLAPVIRAPCSCKLHGEKDEESLLNYKPCRHILAARAAFDAGVARFDLTLPEFIERLLFVDPLLKPNNRHADRRRAPKPELCTLEREDRIRLYMTRHAAGYAIFHPGDLTQLQADQFEVRGGKGRREQGLARRTAA